MHCFCKAVLLAAGCGALRPWKDPRRCWPKLRVAHLLAAVAGALRRVEKDPNRLAELERFAGGPGLHVVVYVGLCRSAVVPLPHPSRSSLTCLLCSPASSAPLPPCPFAFPLPDFTATKKDVFWVTVSQLIEWMLNPVPASQLRASKRMCQPRAAAAAPELPQDGANVTLSFAGVTASRQGVCGCGWVTLPLLLSWPPPLLLFGLICIPCANPPRVAPVQAPRRRRWLPRPPASPQPSPSCCPLAWPALPLSRPSAAAPAPVTATLALRRRRRSRRSRRTRPACLFSRRLPTWSCG